MIQSLLHRPGRDLVELDAPDVGVLVLEQRGHMPGDGLAFAVGVRGQVHGVGLPRLGAQLLDHLLLALDDLVVGLEAMFLIHPKAGLGQVPDVAHGGGHVEILAKYPANGFHFRRRLDDDQFFSHNAILVNHPFLCWQVCKRCHFIQRTQEYL